MQLSDIIDIIVAGPAIESTDYPAKLQDRKEALETLADENSLDDPVVFHGTPIGLQVMGKRLEEERVLAIAGELRRCLLK